MSDHEDNPGASTSPKGKVVLSEADTNFLFTCLRNTTTGSIQIDTTKVATMLNFKNNRTVNNKVGVLRKKFNLPFSATGVNSGSGLGAYNVEGGGSAVPRTPLTRPSKVSKQKTPKTPAKKRPATGRASRDFKTEPLPYDDGFGELNETAEADAMAQLERRSGDANIFTEMLKAAAQKPSVSDDDAEGETENEMPVGNVFPSADDDVGEYMMGFSSQFYD